MFEIAKSWIAVAILALTLAWIGSQPQVYAKPGAALSMSEDSTAYNRAAQQNGERKSGGSPLISIQTPLPMLRTTLAVQPTTGMVGGTVNLTATLSANGLPLAGKQIKFKLAGGFEGVAITNSLGVASISSASLNGLTAGNYSGGVRADFTGSAGFIPSIGLAGLQVYDLTGPKGVA